MINTILFDFDGVIIDTERIRIKQINKMLKKYNLKLTEKDFENFIGTKTNTYLEKRIPNLSRFVCLKIAIINTLQRRFLAKKYKLVSGVKELFVKLKSKKYAIALVTGSEIGFVKKVLKYHSIYHYFDLIVDGSMFSTSKPNPECYNIAIQKLKIKPKEAIVIEDSIVGVEAGKKAKCKYLD